MIHIIKIILKKKTNTSKYYPKNRNWVDGAADAVVGVDVHDLLAQLTQFASLRSDRIMASTE